MFIVSCINMQRERDTEGQQTERQRAAVGRERQTNQVAVGTERGREQQWTAGWGWGWGGVSRDRS